MMPGPSSIEWTDRSWNPVTGCSKVSPGCAHCYAETFAERWRGIPGHAYEQGFDLRLWPTRLDVPLRWRRPARIFVNSMSDLFHEDVPWSFVDVVVDTIRRADWHTFQLLTKRGDRLRDYMLERDEPAACVYAPWLPLPNLWLGVSIENRRFVHRADELRATPAAVRWISAEPLLGPLESLELDGIDWLVAGGESGPRARRCDPGWLRDLRDRCADAGVPFFLKQLGGHPNKRGHDQAVLDGRTHHELPARAGATA
jgi:protein gp37